MRSVSTLLFLVVIIPSLAQELNCTVTVNADQIQTTDRSIFADMERSFANFLNSRKWTNDNLKSHERISCNVFLNISRMPSIGSFTASAQINSARPVFNTNYETVVMNFADREWEFQYIESFPLEYNDNTYISNLTSLLAFYAYVIIGMDYDSFSELGGTPYFQKALAVVNNAQPANQQGWQALTNNRNRYSLIENLNNPQLIDLRKSIYTYHRTALDIFEKDPDKSRTIILAILNDFKRIWAINPNSIFITSFFDAKSTELANIFSSGNLQIRRQAYDILTNIDPKRTAYSKILAD